MTAKEKAVKPQTKGERLQLYIRQQDDPEKTERTISSMNDARRSMGITEIE